MSLLNSVIDTLLIPASLPPENRAHPLSGNWTAHYECHIQPDWLLIYRIEGNNLYLDRTGTHADLFKEQKTQLSAKNAESCFSMHYTLFPSIPQILPDEDHVCLSDAAGGVVEDRDDPVDAARAAAVVTFGLSLGAGQVRAEAAHVQGARHVLRPPEGGIQVRRQLIDARQDIELFVAVAGGGHAVAVPVDIHDLPGLGNGVGGAEIDPGRGGLARASSMGCFQCQKTSLSRLRVS